MHHKPLDSQDKRSFFLHSSSFYLIAIVSAHWTIQIETSMSSVHSLSTASFIIQSWASFLLQNGGDGGTTAAQRSWGLIGFKRWASDRSEPQWWPSHSRYVIETARFLIARCFKELILTIDRFIEYYVLLFLCHMQTK